MGRRVMEVSSSGSKQGYNGWTNYETWCVALWMDNEESSYRYWRKVVLEVYELTNRESEPAKIRFAQRLKDEHEDKSPLIDSANVYTDLLNAALSEVNWYEIAENLISDVTQ